MEECDLIIIVPTPEEFRDLVNVFQIIDTKVLDAVHIHQIEVSEYINNAIAVNIGEMGTIPACQLTEKILNHYIPKLIILIGIGGAIDNELRLGDVVVGDDINEFMADSKAIPKGDTYGFKYSSRNWKTPYSIISFIRNFEYSQKNLFENWREQVRSYRLNLLKEKNINEPDNSLVKELPDLFVGHIASGNIVGAAEAFKAELKSRDRKFLVLEMEAAGVAQAAYARDLPYRTIIIRGISDFADDRKKNIEDSSKMGWRRYAMYSASQFILKLFNTNEFLEILKMKIPSIEEDKEICEFEVDISVIISTDKFDQVVNAVDKINKFLEDPNLALKKVSINSIKLYFSGTKSSFKKILVLHKTGDLSKLIGSDITSIQEIDKNKIDDYKEYNYQETIESYELAIAVEEVIFGSEHPKLATSINSFGSYLQDIGKLDDALQMYYRSLSILENNYDDHPLIADVINNIGSIYQTREQLDEAKDEYRKALDINVSLFGTNHPKVALILNNLGSVFHAQSDLDGALDMYTRAIDIYEEIYSPNHPKLAYTLNNIAGVLEEQGDYENAKNNYQRALRILTEHSPTDKPTIKIIQSNLEKLSA